MKLQAKGKLKIQRKTAIKKLEDNAEITIIKTEPTVAYRGEVPTGEIKQVWADEIEDIYSELGLKLNRPSAEDKALNIIRHLRQKAKVKFANV